MYPKIFFFCGNLFDKVNFLFFHIRQLVNYCSKASLSLFIFINFFCALNILKKIEMISCYMNQRHQILKVCQLTMILCAGHNDARQGDG